MEGSYPPVAAEARNRLRFKATLADARGFLRVLQVCRSIQRDCVIRLQASRIRLFTSMTVTEGVQVWLACRTSFLFSDMVCKSGYDEQSITIKILDMEQLLHVVKLADTRSRPQGGHPYKTVFRLGKRDHRPVFMVSMQGLAGQPDLSFDVPLQILSDLQIQSITAPPLERKRLQVIIPDMAELTTYIDKLKNTAADNVEFFARVLPDRSQQEQHGRAGSKRGRVSASSAGRATLVIHAEHHMASFSLKYDAVELLEQPGSCSSGEDTEAEEDEHRSSHHRSQMEQHDDGGGQTATVAVDIKYVARFLSSVRDVEPIKISMYLMDKRALVLSLFANGNTTVVSYIPSKG